MSQAISIIVCTYNRADSLSVTLQSIRDLPIPPDLNVEVVVVDNNSSDATRKIIEQFCAVEQSIFKYIHEPKQGLSFARNAGLENANGEIIVFTDDDVIVESCWLTEIVRTFETYDADCVGGKILPVWPGKRPSWLSRKHENILALLDYGESVLELKVDDPPLFGANIAFSRRILNKVGNFTTSLGRKGSKLYCGEDTDIYSRIFESNGKVIYQPKAIVNHVISSNRLKKSYFRKWHFDAGEGLGINLGNYDKRNIVGIPYFILRELLVNSINYLVHLLSFRKSAIFYYELKVFYCLGYVLSRVNIYLNKGA